MDEYFAFKNYGKNAEIYRITNKGSHRKLFYSEADIYVQYDVFMKYVSPLIDEFIEEYKSHFTPQNAIKHKANFYKREFRELGLKALRA